MLTVPECGIQAHACAVISRELSRKLCRRVWPTFVAGFSRCTHGHAGKWSLPLPSPPLSGLLGPSRWYAGAVFELLN